MREIEIKRHGERGGGGVKKRTLDRQWELIDWVREREPVKEREREREREKERKIEIERERERERGREGEIGGEREK